MKREWKSFKITLLLYLAILLLPLSIFFNYSNYKDLRGTAYAINKVMKIPEGLLLINSTSKNSNTNRELIKINSQIEKVEEWIEKHKTDDDYVGGRSLTTLYSSVYDCWSKLYMHKETTTALQPNCLKLTHSLIFALERMYILKQKHFEHMLFISGTLLMGLLFLTIFFIRLFLYHQAKKHAIFDFETKLYNRQFLEEIYQSLCAKVKRYQKVFSVTTINIAEIQQQTDSKTKEQMLHKIGKILWDLTRDTDIASRIQEDEFILLMPETRMSQAEIVIGRIKQALEEECNNTLTLKYNLHEVSNEESCTAVFNTCISASK
jgi:diguanylate cyclase (GGDEF)-like protein